MESQAIGRIHHINNRVLMFASSFFARIINKACPRIKFKYHLHVINIYVELCCSGTLMGPFINIYNPRPGLEKNNHI